MTCNNTTHKRVTVVNVDDTSSYTFCIEEENKLCAIKDAFGLTRIELANEPGILSFDIYGISHVPFKFGETVFIRGVPVERSLTIEQLEHMMDQKLGKKLN